MKKTFTINISGIIFHIDDDGYEKLKKYLSSINRRFSNTEEGREIIADIESRIAEIFQEKVNGSKQVITSADVEEMITIMGEPEDFADEGTEDRQSGEKFRVKTGKRIYRDPDNRILGGVCGGLGAYFGIDPIIFRIIFILLFIPFTSGMWIYLILWLIIPEAQTTAQKLEMKGEPVNISNIERSIKDEFDNVKENLKNISKSEKYKNAQSVFDKIISLFIAMLHFLFKLIVAITGIVFIIVGLGLLIGFAGSFIFESWGFSGLHIRSFFNLFAEHSNITLGIIGLTLVVGIPILSIIYGGFKLIFGIKANHKVIGITAFAFWIMGLFFLVFTAFFESRNFRTYNWSVKSVQLQDLATDTLYVEVTGNGDHDKDHYTYWFDDFIIVEEDGKYNICGEAKFDIEKSKTDNYEITAICKARGHNKKQAQQNAGSIDYHWSQRDSLLILDPYFLIPDSNKWRNQDMDIILRVPVGKVVCLHRNTRHIITDIDNVNNIWDHEMAGKKWIMRPDGLSLYEGSVE